MQTLGWLTRPFGTMERCRRTFGDTFSLRIAHEGTWVVVSHPDAVRQVFTGDPRLLHAGEGNVILLPVLGHHSVLLLDEQPHLAQRKLLLPPLHGERLARHAETMREVAEREVASWRPGPPLNLTPRMQDLTLDIIMRTVFGAEAGDRGELHQRLRETLNMLTAGPSTFLLVTLLGPQRTARLPMLRRALEPVDALLFEAIRRRRDDPALGERDDVMSILLQTRYEDGSAMSDREVRDELMTLLVAGHETTATALAWAVERLVRHPAALRRVGDEVADGGEDFLDAVVKETLRLRPVIAVVARRLVEPMEIGGWKLPAGVTVTPSIYLMHGRADLYPEPHVFRPERFLEEPAGTYTWIPFGGGVRRCLGAAFAMQEMKIVLREVIAATQLRPSRPRSERVRRRSITMVPERGGEVLVDAR